MDDKEYLNRVIGMQQKISETHTDVKWLIDDAQKKNGVLKEHDQRIGCLEREALVIRERRSWVVGALRFALGLVGIKI
jgi:hypothetical protein